MFESMAHWLVKTEPTVFSFDDLWNAPKRTSTWDGVRNFQARNFLRDAMKVGDAVLVYHSSVEPMAIAGVAEVVRAGYPDPTQFDRKNHHYDPKAKPETPTWFQVDLRAVKKLKRPVTLAEMKNVPELSGMMLLQRGVRLSVQPVSPEHFRWIVAAGF